MGAAGVVELSWLDLSAAAVLVLLAASIARVRRLGLERSLLIGALRAVLQLVLVGHVLLWLFAARQWWLVLAALTVMLAVAIKTAADRQDGEWWRHVRPMGISLLLGSGVTLAYVTAVVVRVDPWFDPRYLVPLFGMILGNALNAAALAAERLSGEMRARSDEVEAWLALGAAPAQAAREATRRALRAAMIPSVNGLMIVGVVSLPGMMTGQILAGSSPLLAVRYQVLVVFMLAAAAAVSAATAVSSYVRTYFNPAEQLRDTA
jgi:putative ABC transport system permease protein